MKRTADYILTNPTSRVQIIEMLATEFAQLFSYFISRRPKDIPYITRYTGRVTRPETEQEKTGAQHRIRPFLNTF